MKASQIKRLLPAVLQGGAAPGSPLAAILDVMETLHAPSEAILDNIDVYFDPRRTPDAFVPYIASWVDLEPVLDRPVGRNTYSLPSLPTGIDLLRELIASAVSLSQWRGTRKGLLLFLETATGLSGFTIDEQVRGTDGKIIPFHLRIGAPSQAAQFHALVERIIDLEKPAYVTYDLEFEPALELQPTST